MKELIIVADDSFGLDIKKIILSINEYWEAQKWGIPYHIKGYILPRNSELCHSLHPVLGCIEDWIPGEQEYYVMGIVNPQRKQKAVIRLKDKGAVFETLWAPWVMAHLDMKFPEGCIIAAQSIMDSARIGKFVTLFHSMVAFDAVVEDYASVMAYANITTAHIGEGAFIGDNSVVIGKTIQENAVVMPNSVVVKDVKAGTTVIGNPARRIKD